MGSLCGASDQQTAAQDLEAQTARESSAILKIMQQNYGTVFAEDQNILKGLAAAAQPIIASQNLEIASLAPTIAAGPNQFGYTPEQEAAMRTAATEQTAGKSDEAVRGVDVQAAVGKGSMIPSGAVSQLEAMTRQQGLNANAQLQSGITESGFELGNEKYKEALSAEAGLGAPTERLTSAETGTIGAGTQAGSALTGDINATTGAAATSMEGANAIQQANNAWLQPIGGLLGGVGQGVVKKL